MVGDLDLDEAVTALSTISGSLLEGFNALAKRAAHVEDELSRTNAELASKVRELDETKCRLEAILDALPTGVVVQDSEGRITRANHAALQLLGTETPSKLAIELERILETASPDTSLLRYSGSDGIPRVVATRTSAVEDGSLARLGSIRILDDRTEQSALAEQLHAKNKLTSIGTLAAGIAHEIRNPLNAVTGFADLLARSLDGQSQRWARRILAGASEMNSIVGSMLDFANPDQLSMGTVDVEELAGRAIEAALPAGTEFGPSGHPYRITTNIDCTPFLGDRMKLRHALRNLIANAIDVQPNGGDVDVRIEREGGEVVLSVGDAGPGVAPELRDRIADPFFTTRAEGTGLGLALVQTIAQLHGGRLQLHAQPAPLGGAQFSIRIPVTSPCGPA